jgi:transposase
MKPGLSDTGYLQVKLRKDGRYHNLKVHRLVAEAFIGPRPAGMDIRHGSTDRTDNRASNLSYGSRADNEADKVRDGVSNRGERCGSAKLNRDQVRQARRLFASQGLPALPDLAERWSVSQSTIYQVVTRVRWAWLDPELAEPLPAGGRRDSKLTPDQVRYIKSELAKGEKGSVRRLGLEFGVSHSLISHIKTGKLWAWLDAA